LLFAVCFECNEVNIKNSFYLFLKSQEIEKQADSSIVNIFLQKIYPFHS